MKEARGPSQREVRDFRQQPLPCPAPEFLLISSTGALSFRLLLDRLRARLLFVDIQVEFVLKRPKGSLQAIELGCMIKPEQAIDLFAVPAESTRKLSLRRVALA